MLIPVYNGAATLRSALASMQQQTIADIHIIVVDDGSTDETPLILSELAREDPRIEVLTQANTGIVDALNAGLGVCRAEFVARHDADDLADPDRLARQLAYMDEHSDCVAVSSYARHIDTEGRRLSTFATPAPLSLSDPQSVPSREPYLMHPFLMFRRTVVQQLGGYRYVYLSEDTDLFWRLQELGKLHNIPEMMGDYRVHTGSSTSSSTLNARISAMMSQRAAISAVRRRGGRSDLTFPRDALAAYKASPTLEAMIDEGGSELTSDEFTYLKISTSAKLLELSMYRLFEPDLSDCAFARKTYAESALGTDQLNDLLRLFSITAARLFCKGRLREAMTLTPPPVFLKTLARILYKLVLPYSLRDGFRARRNRRQVEAKMPSA